MGFLDASVKQLDPRSVIPLFALKVVNSPVCTSQDQESGDGTNLCVSFGGELLLRAEELLKAAGLSLGRGWARGQVHDGNQGENVTLTSAQKSGLGDQVEQGRGPQDWTSAKWTGNWAKKCPQKLGLKI